MRTRIEHQTFDEERALYHATQADLTDVTFAGPADGESALKEAHDVTLTRCAFSLRYPLWHTTDFTLAHCTMDAQTRAAIWYAGDGDISDSDLNGVKALRECRRVRIDRCRIVSPEFGWKCEDVEMTDSSVESEYLFLDSRRVRLRGVRMKGKYSFQYVDGLEIDGCDLDTKDAFWHSKNATVRDSIIRGEYLAWFSDGLTLVNCTVIGTQPLCYCTRLKLVNCTMIDADLAFEYSDVDAEINGHIVSVKNPRSGRITADSVGEIIRENAVMECTGEVAIRPPRAGA